MLVKIPQVAVEYGRSRHTILNWINRKIVPADCVSRVGKCYTIDADKFRQSVERGEIRFPRHQHQPAKTLEAAIELAAAAQDDPDRAPAYLVAAEKLRTLAVGA